MSKETTTTTSGIGIFGLLGVLFIGLKLTDNIGWSWWLVTMPFWWWAPALAMAGFVMLFLYFWICIFGK